MGYLEECSQCSRRLRGEFKKLNGAKNIRAWLSGNQRMKVEHSVERLQYSYGPPDKLEELDIDSRGVRGNNSVETSRRNKTA